ncbi:hypothetical protein [Priestia filamentosa]|uniref:hypothetical protein n=1 Tax=Priestia filamentosa TaxID=1402861 RepID=UPI002E244049|nr:hypothetical protein [Priestia filamentosa]
MMFVKLIMCLLLLALSYPAFSDALSKQFDDKFFNTLLWEGGTLTLVTLPSVALLWCCKKIVKPRSYRMVFRSVAFLFGLLLVSGAGGVWFIG